MHSRENHVAAAVPPCYTESKTGVAFDRAAYCMVVRALYMGTHTENQIEKRSERMKLGLQLYSVREEYARAPHKVLEQAKAAGFDAVELFGPPCFPATKLAAMLHGAGLCCCGWHVPAEALAADRLYYTAAYHQALGNQNLVIPWYDPQKLASAGDCAQFAAQLNEIAGRLSPEGLHLGYHNHQAEFAPVEGTTAWEILLDQTDGGVFLQYDVGNAARSGQTDVYATLQAMLGRCRTTHCKPFSRDTGFTAVLGRDSIDWERVARQVKQAQNPPDFVILEYEGDGGWRDIADSAANLRAFLAK